MTKRKPTIMTVVEIDAESNVSAVMKKGKGVIISMRTDDDIIDFQGHFTKQPLLPGVTQIDWAIFYGIKYLGALTSFLGMEVIKFQNAIQPNTQIELQLSWQAEKNKLYFTYVSSEGVHSSGRILLGDSDE